MAVSNEELDSIIIQAAQKLGYPTLRPNQHKAIKSFMEGHDVFISLPTGCGKSLCFSVLPYAFDYLYRRVGSIVIVVSPLIALMKDQVATLSSRGLSAAHICSEVHDRFQQEKILRGEVQIVFIGPELLMLNVTWREMLRTHVYRSNLVAFVVDEVHCVTKWGDYFRKEFQILGEVRSLIPPHVNIMGMTATATTTTRDRVISTLGLINPVVVSASPDKPNISYAVRQKVSIEEAFSPLAVKLKTLRRKLPRMIIFCRRLLEATCHQFDLQLGYTYQEESSSSSSSFTKYVEELHKLQVAKAKLAEAQDSLAALEEAVTYVVVAYGEDSPVTDILIRHALDMQEAVCGENAKTTKVTSKEFALRDDPFVKGLDEALQSFKVQRQQYFGGVFVGNHTHKTLQDHVRFVGLNANHMRTSDVTAVQMEGVAVAVFMPFRKDIVDDWAIVVEWPTLVTTTIIPDRWRMHWEPSQMPLPLVRL
ncbi:hypothetical protein EMCRGX_G010620 [Ephydatia muelleri]